MIFRIPEKKTLLVFDLRNGRVVHEIPVTGDAKFAASNQSLVVASAEKKTIQRFNLDSGKLEKSAFLGNINPDLAVMGHAGDGPLCMWQEGQHRAVYQEVRLWNLKTLKEIPKKGERLANLDENKLSVSPDGKVFVGPNIVSKSRMVAMRVGPRSTYLINSRDQLPHIGGKWWMVTEDGERVFRYQNIQYDRQMREFNGVSKPNRNTVIYPNFDGRFSISLEQRGQEAYLSLFGWTVGTSWERNSD